MDTRQTTIDKLHEIFPDGIIYSDVYGKQAGPLTYSVHKLVKEQGVSLQLWLSKEGFDWRETGYIEPDMQNGQDSPSVPSAKEDPLAFADHVLTNYPLIGEYNISKEENDALFQAACGVIGKMLAKERTSVQEEAVLILETVELLKEWDSASEVDEDSSSFWNYIFQQYGLMPQNARPLLYAPFRAAIIRSLRVYRRFLTNEGHKYYNTLLLHAISPKQSIEAFFSILFHFYTKNLDFQYIPNDISYKMFTKGMRARWNQNISLDTDIKLRSDAIASGLRVLFEERPGYMAVLCDSIVRKMDALLRGAGDDSLNPDNNYWDFLLLSWYEQLSAFERGSNQNERRKRKTEYVATSSERIYVHYQLQDDNIGIFIPKIRLQNYSEQRPILRLIQNESLIYEQEMSVTGDDLCLTTRSVFIPLKETDFDFSLPAGLAVTISQQGEQIFNSEKRLLRSFILFDSSQRENRPKSGTAFLYIPDNNQVDFDNYDGINQIVHPGQLYKINLDEVSSITVNGKEILVTEAMAGRFRLSPSVRKMPGLHVLDSGRTVDVFPQPLELQIRFPTDIKPIAFQIIIDGHAYNLSSFLNGEGYAVISSGEDDGLVHDVQIVEVETRTVKFAYSYVILENTHIEFEKTLFRAGTDTVSGAFVQNGFAHHIDSVLPEESHTISFSIPGSMYQFQADVPALICSFMNRNAFSAPETVWHKTIPAGEYVSLALPSNWTGRLMLGTSVVPSRENSTEYELGNLIRSYNPDSTEDMDLWVYAKSETGEIQHFKITTVVFQPSFSYPPLSFEDGVLHWNCQNNFIGEAESSFKIFLSYENAPSQVFSLTAMDCQIPALESYKPGFYSCSVSLEKRNIFSGSTQKVIWESTIANGDPNEFIFQKKEIILSTVLYWDLSGERQCKWALRAGAGIVSRLQYTGLSKPFEESVPVPTYIATLCFEDSRGGRHPFNSKENDQYELINPVTVWIINDNLLVLGAVTGDAVYIDKHSSTIVNRSFDGRISWKEMNARLVTPDYFEYAIKER